MNYITVKQYKEAIQVLLPRQIVGLQILYHCPNSSATAKNLAQRVHPSNPAPITASGMIGRIGKRFSLYLGITPRTYLNRGRERSAYFTLVSDVYDQKNGWTMYPYLKIALEELNLVNNQGNEVSERLPTEILPYEDQTWYKEGKVVQVFVNRYERNQDARIKCIKHYGDKCFACGFDFEDVYGAVGEGFIHVHHKIPLAKLQKDYLVNPIIDLVPLCANCHSVVHLSNPMLTVEELKKLIKKDPSH